MNKILLIADNRNFENKLKRLVMHLDVTVIEQLSTLNVVMKTIKQYQPKVLLIHHSIKHQSNPVIDYLLTNKVIPIIFIHNVSNYGQFYNFLDDIYFCNIEESKVDILLTNAIDQLIKIEREFSSLYKKVTLLENKLYDQQLLSKAKIQLMSEKNLSEEEAYKYIQKQSMDMRISKAKVAELILKHDNETN